MGKKTPLRNIIGNISVIINIWAVSWSFVKEVITMPSPTNENMPRRSSPNTRKMLPCMVTPNNPTASTSMMIPWMSPLAIWPIVFPKIMESLFIGATIMPSIVPISFSWEIATGKPVITLIITVIAIIPGATKSKMLVVPETTPSCWKLYGLTIAKELVWLIDGFRVATFACASKVFNCSMYSWE